VSADGTYRVGADAEALREHCRLLAANAAASLGGQGSPVWARTAELLLLSSPDVERHHRRAALEVARVLDEPPRL
jgi:hypothetical protein